MTHTKSDLESEAMGDVETADATAHVKLRWLLVVGLLAGTAVLFVMGSISGIVGGGLTDWGKGAGGLGGWADLSMTFFSLVVGLAAAVATFRARRSVRLAIAVFFTGLLIGVGYLYLAHLGDPCDRGWWNASSTIGTTRLCAPRGDIADRYHLLLHGLFGVVSAGIAVFIYRRKGLLERWRPGQP